MSRAALALAATGLVSLAMFAPVVMAFVVETDFPPAFPMLGFVLATVALWNARRTLMANPDGGSHVMVVAGVVAAAVTMALSLLLLVAALPLLVTGGA